MSISDDIKEMTQKFVDEKSKKNLTELSLEDMAQTWTSTKEAPDADEQKENMSNTINSEILQNKINEYLVDLNYGRFSPSDFPHIIEFCEEFGYKFANTDMKSQIEHLQETMESCRLNMPHDVNIKLDDNLKSQFSAIPHLDGITISGDKEQIEHLDNKKSTIGKTFSFTDDNNKVIGGVEFDKQNDAHILYTNKDDVVVEYKLTKDNQFYIVNEDKTETLLDIKNPKSLSTQDIRAYNLAKASGKLWQKFTNKELDKNVKKSQTRVSEEKQQGQQKQQTQQKTTKINESEDAISAPQTTRFDEKPSKEKKEADFNNEADNETAFPDNKFEWKEDDIIKVMFQDWFLAAANSATSFVLNHIEYAAAGIWNTLEKSYRTRSKEEKKAPEEKPDVTHQFYNGIESISQKNTENLQNGSNNQEIIQQVRDGKVQDILAQNDLLRDFAQHTKVDVSGLLSQGDPEKTVPLMTNMAALFAKTTDTYARAALLDEKMRDKHSYDGINQEDLYAQKRKEGASIIKKTLAEELKKNPQNNNLKFFTDTLTNISKDMDGALKIGLKDYDKKRYDENGKEPKENKTLQKYKDVLTKQEPQNLYDFAKQQEAINSSRDFVLSGLNTEKDELYVAQQVVDSRRKALEQTKQFIMNGVTNTKQPQTPQIQIPLRPQGRE